MLWQTTAGEAEWINVKLLALKETRWTGNTLLRLQLLLAWYATDFVCCVVHYYPSFCQYRLDIEACDHRMNQSEKVQRSLHCNHQMQILFLNLILWKNLLSMLPDQQFERAFGSWCHMAFWNYFCHQEENSGAPKAFIFFWIISRR